MDFSNLKNRLLYEAQRRAKRNNLHFSLRHEHITIPKFCPVFGIELKQSKGFPGPASPTLDRIDNTIGYVPWNVCVISYKANMLKGNATLDELRALVHYLELNSPNIPAAEESVLAHRQIRLLAPETTSLPTVTFSASIQPNASFRHLTADESIG